MSVHILSHIQIRLNIESYIMTKIRHTYSYWDIYIYKPEFEQMVVLIFGRIMIADNKQNFYRIVLIWIAFFRL